MEGQELRSTSPKTKAEPMVLGSPVFDLEFNPSVRHFAPLGEEHLALECLESVENRETLALALYAEYRDLVATLLREDVPFRVLNPQAGGPEVDMWLADLDCPKLGFDYPRSDHWTRFPRDMAVALPDLGVLLVNPQLFRLAPEQRYGYQILPSEWGEGGRVLTAGRRMLVSAPPLRDRLPDCDTLDFLRSRGMQIAPFPQPIFKDLSHPTGKGDLFHEAHIDRVAGLIQDSGGGYHLIVSPGYRTGPHDTPWSAAESLSRLKENCQPAEMTVHQPEVSVPYGASVVQLPDGRVLASSGNGNVPELLQRLLGPDQVILTGGPLVHYPVFAQAGLHCLLTENPTPLVVPQEESQEMG